MGLKKDRVMLKELINLANHLDAKGLRKESDYLDSLMQKWAEELKDHEVKYLVQPGDNFSTIVEKNSSRGLSDNVDLNKKYDSDFDPDKITAGKHVWIYSATRHLDGTSSMRILAE